MSTLPKLPPHRPSETAKAVYQLEVEAFCARLLEVRSGYDKPIGSRGWAYLLEGDGIIAKDELDAAQKLINDCRKSGDLPLDFCSEDEKRASANVEDIDANPKRRARELFDYVKSAEQYYHPFSFWEDLDVYVQMAVEKSDLKNLFEDVCAEFNVPIANFGGCSDIIQIRVQLIGDVDSAWIKVGELEQRTLLTFRLLLLESVHEVGTDVEPSSGSVWSGSLPPARRPSRCRSTIPGTPITTSRMCKTTCGAAGRERSRPTPCCAIRRPVATSAVRPF
jgi:hypothetical protein